MKTFGILLFVLVISFGTIKPLIMSGFFPIHDDTQVSRVFEMGKALKDGMFPVRWVADLGYGYGYPIFNFYAPLSYYVGGLLDVLGFDALLATKLMVGIGLILSSLFMFFLGRELWGNSGGVLSSLLYSYSPYHALNTFVRGDFAEVWAYAFIPLFFYGIIKIYRTYKVKFIFITALALAAIILSHNLTAFMLSFFSGVTVIFLFYLSKNRLKLFLLLTLSFGLGLLLSSFYFLPAILEMGYTNVFSQIGGGADFRNNFVCLRQLWDSPWGFGGSIPGCIDGLSFRIGKLHILLSFLFVISLTVAKIKEKAISILFAFLFLLSIFFMQNASRAIWEIFKPMEFIQYPWRFLLFASFFSSLLGGGTIQLVKLLPKNIFRHADLEYTIILTIAIVFIYAKLFVPQTILFKNSNDYTNQSLLSFNISKISDEYMPKGFERPESLEQVPSKTFVVQKGKGEIKLLQKKTHEIKAMTNVSPNSVIHANIAYFPAWKVFVNGEKAKINVKNNGFEFDVPNSKSEIALVFSQTQIEKIANTLSVIALVILFTGIIFRKKLHES